MASQTLNISTLTTTNHTVDCQGPRVTAHPEPHAIDLTTAYESTVVDNTAPHTPVEAIAQVGNLACRALIDTGSRVNLISRVLYDCILADQEASPELFPTSLQPVRGALHGAGSDRLRLLGRLKLKVMVGADAHFLAYFLVAENLMCHMIWGDYLLGVDQLNVILDFQDRLMYSRCLDYAIPLDICRRRSRLRKRRQAAVKAEARRTIDRVAVPPADVAIAVPFTARRSTSPPLAAAAVAAAEARAFMQKTGRHGTWSPLHQLRESLPLTLEGGPFGSNARIGEADKRSRRLPKAVRPCSRSPEDNSCGRSWLLPVKLISP